MKTHLLRIFGELGVDDRTAAVTRACGTGCSTHEEGAGQLPGAFVSGGQPSLASSSATISFTPIAVCSPDSMSLSWTTPSARSRSPATTV